MLHLSIERLAALADDMPTAEERLHLDGCDACAREVHAHAMLLATASNERGSSGVPLTEWGTLSARLTNEGLLAPARMASGRMSNGLRAAAVLLLIGGGALIGRASAGTSLIPGGLTGREPMAGASAE